MEKLFVLRLSLKENLALRWRGDWKNPLFIPNIVKAPPRITDRIAVDTRGS